MLTIFTIVLNGMPFIERHLAEFQKLKIPWRWRIVEGVSEPLGCTRWCKQVPEKWHKDFKSIDGTHEYLNSIQGGNVIVYSQGKPFNGKLEIALLPRLTTLWATICSPPVTTEERVVAVCVPSKIAKAICYIPC